MSHIHQNQRHCPSCQWTRKLKNKRANYCFVMSQKATDISPRLVATRLARCCLWSLRLPGVYSSKYVGGPTEYQFQQETINRRLNAQLSGHLLRFFVRQSMRKRNSWMWLRCGTFKCQTDSDLSHNPSRTYEGKPVSAVTSSHCSWPSSPSLVCRIHRRALHKRHRDCQDWM